MAGKYARIHTHKVATKLNSVIYLLYQCIDILNGTHHLNHHQSLFNGKHIIITRHTTGGEESATYINLYPIPMSIRDAFKPYFGY